MEGLLILLLFPLAWPFVAKRIWHTTINWTEMTIQIVVVVMLTSGVWFAGTMSATHDTEIWNGKIVSKDRVHGTYVESYDCRCRQVTSGSGDNKTTREVCDTCYRDHYTVTWSANSTVGSIQFDHLDRTSRSVYNTPDPAVYTRCAVGEPASREHSYTNYVQAVPESLFNTDSTSQAFVGKIPNYPRVYNHYRINRVISVGSKIPAAEIAELNSTLNEMLINLGASKQVNFVVILTEIDDPTYRYAVEQAWLGAEKNDVVLFIGLDDKTITWVDVMTWALNSGNELLNVQLRDAVLKVGVFDSPKISYEMLGHVSESYVRPQMKSYEYLADQVQPPIWAIGLAIFFAIGGSLLLTFVFHIKEVDDVIGNFFSNLFNRG